MNRAHRDRVIREQGQGDSVMRYGKNRQVGANLPGESCGSAVGRIEARRRAASPWAVRGAAIGAAAAAMAIPGMLAAQTAPSLQAARHAVTVNTGGITAHQVLVDGRVVLNDTNDEFVSLHGPFSGGNACAAQYQALDLSRVPPTLSPVFGNCSDLTRVTRVGSALRVVFPVFRAGKAERDVYQNGRLSHG